MAARVGCKGKKPGWTVLPISARTAALALSLFIWSVVERSACAGFASYLDEQNPASDTVTDVAANAASLRFFEQKIRPVLVTHCYECHSSAAADVGGALLLDTREGIRRGGERGPAVVPGDPAHSLLLTAVRGTIDSLQMPPDERLSDEIVRDFEIWIREGAVDPREGDLQVVTSASVTAEQGRAHWAYRAPVRPSVPQTATSPWPLSDIDRFVLAAQQRSGLQPVSDADWLTLLRRLSFDLTGLPPTETEIDAMRGGDFEQAWNAAVDRLLDSPHFGEKWARHWLDVARYAESTGGTVNFFYPHAWRYRDYVIDAFNADMPFDQFIREQLAGDLLPASTSTEQARQMIATGFLALGTRTLNERDGLKHELDLADEQINITTQAFLGVTLACARCHDHKFDPFSQADYYAMAGIFRSTETCYGTVRFINAQRPSELISLPSDAGLQAAVKPLTAADRNRIEAEIQQVQERAQALDNPTQRFLTLGRISLLRAELEPYEPDGSPQLLAMGVRDKPVREFFRPRRFGNGSFGQGANRFSSNGSRTIADSPVFARGEPESPQDQTVARGIPELFADQCSPIARGSSGRLELADWIASSENPLTARVMVNRVWLQLFGRGLVPTADDFGLAGQQPTHPELLDHLALQFVDQHWSIKQLIRSIVTSRVYRLSATMQQEAFEADPDNKLCWRMTPRRLDAESLRDAMLAVSGLLDADRPLGSIVAERGEGPVDRFGGLPVARLVNDSGDNHRSIYLPVIRDNLPESMALFDAADPSLVTAVRQPTTVPAQGLYLLNSEFLLRVSDALAESLLQLEDPDDRVQAAFVRITGDLPDPTEQQAAAEFLQSYRNTPAGFASRFRSAPELDRWSALCQALLSSAEFQFRR